MGSRTPRLPAMPQGDPAGGGRLRPSPRARNIAHSSEANPYIPDMKKAGVAEGGKTLYSIGGGGDADADRSQVAFNGDSGASPRGGRESPGSFRASSMPADASQHMSEAALKNAKRKRLERLHDLYQTSFSRETLLSEQYSKELAAARELLHEVLRSGESSGEQIKARDEGARRKKAKLEKRISTLETKLNGLETYNVQLVTAINNLRMQNGPVREAFRGIARGEERLREDVAKHKHSASKALDEREALVDKLRRFRDDWAGETLNFREQARACCAALRRTPLASPPFARWPASAPRPLPAPSNPAFPRTHARHAPLPPRPRRPCPPPPCRPRARPPRRRPSACRWPAPRPSCLCRRCAR